MLGIVSSATGVRAMSMSWPVYPLKRHRWVADDANNGLSAQHLQSSGHLPLGSILWLSSCYPKHPNDAGICSST